MPNTDHSDETPQNDVTGKTATTGKTGRRRATLPLAAAAMLALGGAAGATLMAHSRPSVTMAPATPNAIRTLSSGGIVTIAGRVAEIYGNKFILADASGRALVETGREGEDGRLVTAGEPVTVQGRFEHGFVHAGFLVGPDRKVIALGPLGHPPHDRDHGPHGHDRGPHGPDDGARDFDDGPDAPPAPTTGRTPEQASPAPATTATGQAASTGTATTR